MEYLTLLEASKLIQDPLRSGIIEIFPRTSAVLERLPFYSINGNSYKYNQESVLPSIGFRSLNESYTADVGVLNPVTESLVIPGRDQSSRSCPCEKSRRCQQSEKHIRFAESKSSKSGVHPLLFQR